MKREAAWTKKFEPPFFLSLLSLLVLLALPACSEEGADIPLRNRLVIETQDGKKHLFYAELALTPAQQGQGLMHRVDMPDTSGMLFYFGPEEAERGFWMKNTLIPLDMLFIKKDGRIHHIHEKATPHDLTTIPSNGPVAAVFEINGGLSSRIGIKAGDKVLSAFFNSTVAE